MSDAATIPATAVTWFEIPAADLPRAQRFYQTILETPLRTENFAGSDIAIFPAQDGGVRGHATSDRTMRPLGLYFWGKVWTLAAWCELRDELSKFPRRSDQPSAAGRRVPRRAAEDARGLPRSNALDSVSIAAGA